LRYAGGLSGGFVASAPNQDGNEDGNKESGWASVAAVSKHEITSQMYENNMNGE
jgi:hypothetical protein